MFSFISNVLVACYFVSNSLAADNATTVSPNVTTTAVPLPAYPNLNFAAVDKDSLVKKEVVADGSANFGAITTPQPVNTTLNATLVTNNSTLDCPGGVCSTNSSHLFEHKAQSVSASPAIMAQASLIKAPAATANQSSGLAKVSHNQLALVSFAKPAPLR